MIGRVVRSTAVRVVLTVAILAYLTTRIDMRAALAAVLQVNRLHLVAVLALVMLDRVVMIWRWVLLLRSSHEAVSVGAAARIYLISSFVGSFLPAGVGADAARAYTWSRQTAAGSEAVASVGVDRLLGMLSIVLLGVVGAVTWAGRMDANLRGATWLLAGLVLLACAAVWWADVALKVALPTRWRSSPVGIRLIRLTDALGRYRGRRGTLVFVMVLSLGVQLLRILQVYLLGRGLGIDVGFAYYFVFMPIGLLILLLPVSVSGFGLPQGVIVWLLRPVGVPDALSFALSSLIVLTGLAGNLPGAWLYVSARKDVE